MFSHFFVEFWNRFLAYITRIAVVFFVEGKIDLVHPFHCRFVEIIKIVEARLDYSSLRNLLKLLIHVCAFFCGIVEQFFGIYNAC